MPLAVGVDVSEKRGLDVVLLDEHRRLQQQPLSRVTPNELRDLLVRWSPEVAVVAIDSPPGIGGSGAARPCETILRRRGVQIFSTPGDPERFAGAFYNWVRIGQQAFEATRAAGFQLFRTRGDGVAGCAIEVFPHATDVFLRGYLPPAGTLRTVAGKQRWRAETLRLAGVDGAGQLSSPDAVDAALAALTGVCALAGEFEAIGEEPFFIVVPPSATVRFARLPAAGARDNATPAKPRVVGDFELDANPHRVDIERLWRFLSEEAYWGQWRRRADVERQLASAWRVVAAYERSSGEMVGFARAISDGVATAYLADVYVERRARGRGLGVALVEEMVERGVGVSFRWMLHTADAHGLYERFGFIPPDRRYLERPARQPNPPRGGAPR